MIAILAGLGFAPQNRFEDGDGASAGGELGLATWVTHVGENAALFVNVFDSNRYENS